jgi:hypothetical protein
MTDERQEKDESVNWYPSKVDGWLIPLLALPPISATIVCVSLAASGKPGAAIIGAVILGFVAALYLGLIFPLRYGVGHEELTIRSGICRKRIPLANITEVRPTRNPLSSPALSLDRLHVQFGQGLFGAVMISPDDREGFLADLAAKAGLSREGERLFRA